jgi:hypothetical protein
MHDGGRTKEAFLATIRFLCHSGVQAHDGCHLKERMLVLLRHMFANNRPTNFWVWIVRLCLVEFALTTLAV